MPAEAAAAFTQPLPAAGAASLSHLTPTSDMAYPLSKLGVRALVKREARSFGQRDTVTVVGHAALISAGEFV